LLLTKKTYHINNQLVGVFCHVLSKVIYEFDKFKSKERIGGFIALIGGFLMLILVIYGHRKQYISKNTATNRRYS